MTRALLTHHLTLITVYLHVRCKQTKRYQTGSAYPEENTWASACQSNCQPYATLSARQLSLIHASGQHKEKTNMNSLFFLCFFAFLMHQGRVEHDSHDECNKEKEFVFQVRETACCAWHPVFLWQESKSTLSRYNTVTYFGWRLTAALSDGIQHAPRLPNLKVCSFFLLPSEHFLNFSVSLYWSFQAYLTEMSSSGSS